jgi:Mg/Co/Ni transporter MgtE
MDWHRLFGLILTDFFTDSPFGEGITMSYTMADYRRDKAMEYLKNLTPEGRREAFQSLTPDEQREVLQGLSPQERLAGLSAKEIAKYLKDLQSERPTQKSKPRRRS